MKERVLAVLERFSQAMIQPLLILPGVGVLFAAGALLTNSVLTGLLPPLQWEPVQLAGQAVYNAGSMLVDNLALLFAVGLPAGLAHADKHRAGLLGAAGLLTAASVSHTLLEAGEALAVPDPALGLVGTGQAEILGIQCMDLGVAGAVLLGCAVGWIFNKTEGRIAASLWGVLGFAALFGAAANLVWPAVQAAVAALAVWIEGAGALGLFFYGSLERLLLPTGLHHLVYTPFLFSDLGGTLQLGGRVLAGAYPVAMAELQAGLPFSEGIYYLDIGFVKMFGYLGIGAAFIATARPGNRRHTAARVLPLMLTACLGSVTEPMDFLFVFAAPGLYLLHCGLAGLFMALLKLLDIHAFCGGNLPVSLLLNIGAGAERTRWPAMLVLGLVQAAAYFGIFWLLIRRFGLRTPGREELPAPAALPPDAAQRLVQGLGGAENILSLDSCMTRLRLRVAHPDRLDEAALYSAGARAVVRKGQDLHLVYGPGVERLRLAVEEQLKTACIGRGG